MPIFDILNIAMNALSCFLLTGFVGAFIIPDVFMWEFVILPRALGAAVHKKIHYRGAWRVFRKGLFWLIFTVAIYFCAYLISPDIFWYLITSATAVLCALLCIFITVRTCLTKRGEYLDAFYKGIYMEFMTDEEQERYQEFIEGVEKMSIAEARDRFANGQLDYLERVALTERINLLQATSGQEGLQEQGTDG